MGIKEMIARIPLLARARRQREPERETVPYARLMQLGNMLNQKAQVKPAPPNLRYFSRTPYARAAIRRIRDSVQRLNWQIVPAKGVQRNASIDQQIAVATACFHHPNSDQNWQAFIGECIEDWCTFGAGVYEQEIGNDPIRPLWLWPVDAQSIQIYAGWDGSKTDARYLQTLGYTNVGFLEGNKLRNDEIVYIKANSSTETPYGFGPLEIAFNTINRQLGVAEYSGNLATNAQPQTLLFFKDADADKLRAFRAYWRDEVEGQGMTPIFGGQNEPTAVQLHPGNDAALYLEYQEFVIREIATAFGLSPMNLGIAKDVNRNTAEVESDRDWDNAIVPPAELFQAHITRETLHKRLGFYQLQFEFEGLYREDEESRAKIFTMYYQSNRTTPNMHRIECGLPPMENKWADMTYVETQIAQIAAKGAGQILSPESVAEGDESTASLSVNQNIATYDTDDQT